MEYLPGKKKTVEEHAVDKDGQNTYIVSCCMYTLSVCTTFPVSILRKSILGRHRPVRVADDVDLRRMLAGFMKISLP